MTLTCEQTRTRAFLTITVNILIMLVLLAKLFINQNYEGTKDLWVIGGTIFITILIMKIDFRKR